VFLFEIFSSMSNDSSAGVVVSAPESSWQRSLAEAIRDPRVLLERLALPADLVQGCGRAIDEFPLLVPESYLHRMQPGDPDDPLLRQVLPLADESMPVPGFIDDPVGDAPARTAPGLLHKYHGRALLISQTACAVHCRYCFRRHYPYREEPKTAEDWAPAIAALRSDPSLHEVILSGGDPLVSSDRRLEELIGRIETIPHVRRLRIHTRLPIVLPDRVTDRLIGMLHSTRLRVFIVVHANHGRELVADCADAVTQLVESGLPVLNQAVLLRGVNDSLDALRALCERCIDLGVLPYYLHQLDRVRGAAHFEVPVETGLRLIDQLRALLPGYAVPQYVQEVPADGSKRPLTG
jgi:EF-P beta-lysylation protein EpmB